ncbi:OsmC family protein [Aquimarina sp. AU58]|uniref:OsmC family protein n=1 Tax=Aquimarina sp. AU58 TaxID=1874112 RepID=UPI000D6E9410|nr:OsmC family protein [Aquimarina sp. AU58]
MINGINLEALGSYKNTVEQDPKNGMYSGGIKATWLGGTKVGVETNALQLGDEKIPHSFSFVIDEPEQLLGEHSSPTPQDYLLGGLSGCMMVTFVAMASIKGIELEGVSLEIKSSLDLQGFLGINETSPVGFDTVEYCFTVEGNGTEQDFKEIADQVIQFSPNYATVSNKVKMISSLVVNPTMVKN